MEKNEIFRDKEGKVIGEVIHTEGEGTVEHFGDAGEVHHLENITGDEIVNDELKKAA